jgi:transposase
MVEILTMSISERQRLQIVARIKHGNITVSEAAQSLGITERQMYRLLARCKAQGDAGLIHRLRGRPSNQGYSSEVREAVLRWYQERYSDYGPTLFSEMLLDYHNMEIDPDTLRRWLSAANLWKGVRAPRRHRKQRPRRDAIGALVQFDGSFHDWFEGRAPACCLLVAIDDASGQVFMRFAESENTRDVLVTLWAYCERYGIMHEFYTDHGSVYHDKHHRPTDTARALNRLGVRLVKANSPQAKGRVERSNRTHQDRLIKALRREGISSIREANEYLETTYIQDHNRRFARTDHLQNIHRPTTGLDFKNIFCFETIRTLYNDCTVTLLNRFYQLERHDSTPLPAPGSRITVRRWLDGTLHFFSNERELGFTPLAHRPKPKPRTYGKPAKSHPWRLAKIGKGRFMDKLKNTTLASQ